jgi:hypothetical protein
VAKKDAGKAQLDEIVSVLQNMAIQLDKPEVNWLTLSLTVDGARQVFNGNADSAVQTQAALKGLKDVPTSEQFQKASNHAAAALEAIETEDAAATKNEIQAILTALGK